MGAFGVDVLDPAVSTRRVGVLLRRLPPSALRGGETWSTEAELLAALIDQVAALTWVTIRAAGGRAAKPKPLPRPSHRGAKREPAQAPRDPSGPVKHGSWADAAAALAAIPGMG